MPIARKYRGRIQELVRDATGLHVPENALQRLERWVQARMHALALAGIEPYAALLDDGSDAGDRERLTADFSTGETYFFRDQGQMEVLAMRILPELIERRAVHRSLRLWSAGCASRRATAGAGALSPERPAARSLPGSG